MGLGEEVVEDYRTLRLSLKCHPLALLRARLAREGVTPNARLARLESGKEVTVAGLVLVRQRPGTAKGVIFATLEDETGVANVIIWPKTYQRFRSAVLGARLLEATGKLQRACASEGRSGGRRREGLVIHVVADKLADLSERLALVADQNAEPKKRKIQKKDCAKQHGSFLSNEAANVKVEVHDRGANPVGFTLGERLAFVFRKARSNHSRWALSSAWNGGVNV